MTRILRLIDRLDWLTVMLVCATLGLAPFRPEPHVWEKLKMLFAGDLVRPMDMFDLVMHGLPWLVAGIKAARQFRPPVA